MDRHRKKKIETWARCWGPLAAFVILALMGGYILEQQARDHAQELSEASIASCERTNMLREQVNRQAQVMSRLVTFTADRMAASGTSPDLDLVEEFRLAASQMEAIPITQCEAAYPQFGLGGARDG